MEILSWEDLLRKERNVFFPPIALTIGVFDGVHRGHQTLLQRILEKKDECPWVITFKSNPSKVLFPETYVGDLMTLDQKLKKMEGFGIKGTVIIDFSQDFGRLKGAEFFFNDLGDFSSSVPSGGRRFSLRFPNGYERGKGS